MTHPRKGDIHRVENAYADRTSISARSTAPISAPSSG